MTHIDGGVTAPKGYRASGVSAGIRKKPGRKDCALVCSDFPTQVAGMFTTNVMKSPPVMWNVRVCENGVARAVFINSGNANAATGAQGVRDVESTAKMVGNGLGISPDEVCICSTGVIGVPLPMDRIAKGVEESIERLGATGSPDAAEAIMTTDTVPKEFAAEIELSGGSVRLGAIAKGSGMLCPNLATMICVITTDASIEGPLLRKALGAAVERSFHKICVDNDLSTSDTVLVFANGQSDAGLIVTRSDDFDRFREGLEAVCLEMAWALVRDGEGASKFVEINVSGTVTDDDACRIARTIAQSQLCKTAFFGEDPNWGRIACAAGYSGVPFDPSDLEVYFDDLAVVASGSPTDYNEADAAVIMQRNSYRIGVSVGAGPGRATFWTSDLSYDYVRINAEYRT